MDYPRNGSSGWKWAAVGLIALLEIGLVFYLYISPANGQTQNPVIFPTSSSTTSSTTVTQISTSKKPVDHLTVDPNPLIQNGTIGLTVHNIGPSSTSFLTVTSVCTPNFAQCFDYKKLNGAYWRIVFDLPAGGSFRVNMTGVCFMPIYKCRNYLPVVGYTYFMQLRFDYSDGATVAVNLAPKANNTWVPRNVVQNLTHISVIQNVNLTNLWIYQGNRTGTFAGIFNSSVWIDTSFNDSFSVQLNGYQSGTTSGFNKVLITNTTSCGGTNQATCSSPTVVGIPYYTVLTAITAGNWYAGVVHDLTHSNDIPGLPDSDETPTFFGFWVQAQNGP